MHENGGYCVFKGILVICLWNVMIDKVLVIWEIWHREFSDICPIESLKSKSYPLVSQCFISSQVTAEVSWGQEERAGSDLELDGVAHYHHLTLRCPAMGVELQNLKQSPRFPV